LRILTIGLLVVGLLTGCATTAVRQDLGGLVSAENPEYLAHPLRMISLGFNLVGNIAQYGVVEPMYFMLAPIPELVGLSLEERRYLEKRKEAWEQYFAGQRPAVQ
jgi:hypothetical protein